MPFEKRGKSSLQTSFYQVICHLSEVIKLPIWEGNKFTVFLRDFPQKNIVHEVWVGHISMFSRNFQETVDTESFSISRKKKPKKHLQKHTVPFPWSSFPRAFEEMCSVMWHPGHDVEVQVRGDFLGLQQGVVLLMVPSKSGDIPPEV